MNFEMLALFGSKKHSLLVTRYSLLLFLFAVRNLVAEPWEVTRWNSTGGESPQQQQQYLRQQKQNWKQQDQRAVQKRWQQEHQKWEREQKKREKSALKLLQPVAFSP
ncbi:MAG: hypothetical protein WCO92_00875 [Verrucomicrobiota bacterium]